MQKKLKTCATGWELYFSKQMLQLLGYNPAEVTLLITANGKKIYIEPIDNVEKYKNHMLKPLQKSGYSYGLYFSKTLIEVLELNPETDFLDIDISGNKLTIKKLDT